MLILKETNFRKETTLYVDDTAVGVELAKRNFVNCVAVFNL